MRYPLVFAQHPQDVHLSDLRRVHGRCAEQEDVIPRLPYFNFVDGDPATYDRFLRDNGLLDLTRWSTYEESEKFYAQMMQWPVYEPEKHDSYIAVSGEGKDAPIVIDGLHRATILYKNGYFYVPIQWHVPNVSVEQQLGKIGQIYHELPFSRYKYAASRGDLILRSDMITRQYCVADKVGLDVGSFIGGLTFVLQMLGARMFGVENVMDHHLTSVALEREHRTGAQFIYTDVIELARAMQRDRPSLDFIVWFSSFHWVAKQSGLQMAWQTIDLCSQACPVLFFESATVGSSQDGMIKDILAHSQYRSAKKLGESSWLQRSIYFLTR